MKLPNSLQLKMGKLGHAIAKISPTVGTAAGVCGIAATAYLASKATLKAQDVMKSHHEMVESLDKMHKMHKDFTPEELDGMRQQATTPEEAKYVDILEEFDSDNYAKAHFGTWTITAGRLAKLYAPAVLVGLGSATLILLSHKAMSNRVGALTAAYTALQTSFNEYRGFITEKFGKETDDAALMSETERMREDAKKSGSEPKIPDGRFERVFGEGRTRCWSRNPQDNIRFLSAQQNYFNDLLHLRGHVFLNEVYEALGFQTVPAGQMVGWMYTGDEGSVGYVDFGIFDTENLVDRLAMGVEDWHLLKFNIDGVIYNQI